MSSVKSKAAKGTAWMLAARQAIRVLGLISTFVLARILMPADFGLVAQSMMVLGFIELLSSFGFELSLIQDDKAGRDQYDTVWTLNIIKAMVSGVLLGAVAYPMATFFSEPRLENVIYALAVVSLLRGFANIGVINFRKQLWFGPEFALMVAPKVVGIAFNIGFALYLRSYWALVIGWTANSVATLLFSYVASRYRPRFTLCAWREMFGFSKWVLVSSYISFLSNQAPVFLLGKFIGSAEVGFYKMASEIGDFVSSEIYLPALRALYPAYAKDKDKAGELYLDAVGICFLILAPACIGIALVARPAVEVFLGERWMSIVPLIQVLAIARLLFSVWLSPGAVAMAHGRSRDTTLLTMMSVVVSFPALVILVPKYGSEGAVWAILMGTASYYITCFIYVMKTLRVSALAILAIKWRTLGSIGVMSLVLLQMPDNLWRIPAGAAVYMISQFLLWHLTGRKRGPEYHLFTRIGFKA